MNAGWRNPRRELWFCSKRDSFSPGGEILFRQTQNSILGSSGNIASITGMRGFSKYKGCISNVSYEGVCARSADESSPFTPSAHPPTPLGRPWETTTEG